MSLVEFYNGMLSMKLSDCQSEEYVDVGNY